MSDLAGIDTTKVSTSAEYSIKRMYSLNHPIYGGGFWMYGQADEALTAGQFVFYTMSDGGLTLMDTTEAGATPKFIGVTDAVIASASYGWVWVGQGEYEAIVVNAVSANTQLTTTGTAGSAGTGGDTIAGLRNIDAGVTDTRVTVTCPIVMYAGA